jgi:F420-dependent oxidoreductase-like protein
MRICLMIEGQEDVDWRQWLAIARACEDAGLEGLFRSDHYLSVVGRTERGSLDAWTTLAGLAVATARIRLGTLVSPVTFRHPSVVAKAAATVDHISGGRVELGLGGGWNQAEHTAYGFDLPPGPERMELLAEQLEIVHRSWSQGPFDFDGKHYRIRGLDALPKPVQRPHPWLLVGGSAGSRSAALAARWADEYNTIFAAPDECRRRREVLATAWRRAGRDPGTLRFSLMTQGVVGRDRGEALERVAAALARSGRDDHPEELLASPPENLVVGTVDQVVERLRQFQAAGVDRVMLQHLDHDDLDMIALLGREVVPAVA